MAKTLRNYLLILLITCSGYAGLSVALPLISESVLANTRIAYLVDDHADLSIEQIRTTAQNRFKAVDGLVLNTNVSGVPVWLKINTNRTQGASANWVLEIPFIGINEITLYQPNGATLRNGGAIMVHDRPIFTRYYAFPVTLSDGQDTFYLKVQSDYPITLPINLVPLESFYQLQTEDDLLQFLYFGGLLSLALYNLMLYLSLRDHKYLLYSVATIFTGLGIFAGNGYGRTLLWQNSPRWDSVSQSVLLSIGAFFSLQFSTAFLKTRIYLPKTHALLQVFKGVFFLVPFFLLLHLISTGSVTIPVHSVYQAFFVTGLLSPIVVFGASVRNIRRRMNSAKYFLVAWGVLCIGAVIAGARLLNLIPSTFFTLYALQISSGIEMVLLSFALAYRFKAERDKKEKAQEALINAQNETVEALKISEDLLEKAVESRTHKLQRLLLSEQHIRSQYTRFCALVAHEFRNPLNIIQAQATLLSHDPTSSAENIKKRGSVIRSAITRLTTLFDQWLENDRINMAMDQLQLTSIPLPTWLNEVCSSCSVYHGDHLIQFSGSKLAVTVEADQHLLEIALLNLIDNACKYSPKGSAIKVKVVANVDEGEVGISIQDEGPGIASDKLRCILEPYVRAAHDKDAPDGIGLGLTFVQRIMELHNGRIDIQSTIGQGTLITLWLHIT